jgi:hypothetical protein
VVVTENEYHEACREIARNGTSHFFDPWVEPGKFGSWMAYWRRIGVHSVMIRCVMKNEWPSDRICVPAKYPREFDRRNADLQSDLNAANAWMSEVRRMARRGELPAGAYSKLKDGGVDLPAMDSDVKDRRDRIMKGFELLSMGRYEDAKRAVMPSAAPQEAAGRDSSNFWYDDI